MKFRLDHVNITVHSLDESIAWYQRVLGFQLVEKEKWEDGDSFAIVAQDDHMICMTEYPERDYPDGKIPTQLKMNHFGLRVNDEAQWREVVARENLELFYGGITEHRSSRSWYIKDPNGHLIEVSYADREILEFPPLSMEATDASAH